MNCIIGLANVGLHDGSHDGSRVEEDEASNSAVADVGPDPEPTTKPRPKQVRKKTPYPAQGSILLTELEDYVRKKKAESYKDGNGFLRDYEVSVLYTGECIILYR